MLVKKNKCMAAGEEINFVEVYEKKRTGQECLCVIERVYEKKLIKFRIKRRERNARKKKTGTSNREKSQKTAR